MYVDESGDPGIGNHNSPHYILSGMIINDTHWQIYLHRLRLFRKHLKVKYNLKLSTEIHASELIRINKLKEYAHIRKSLRLQIFNDYCRQIPKVFDNAKVINICVDKSNYTSNKKIQLFAWQKLANQFNLFLKKDKDSESVGIIISDDTDASKIMNLFRKMRILNSYNSQFPKETLTYNIIEDLFQRSSQHSYFIQSVDIIAHALYRMEFPKGSLKKFGAEKYFLHLLPILLQEANPNDALGIIRD
jgi:hypothetical protein